MTARHRVAITFVAATLSLVPLGSQTQTVPFFLVGHIEALSLRQCTGASVLCGADMKVNGTTVRIPSNTILFLPATLLTPDDLFKFQAGTHPKASPGDPLQPFSGLALEDPAPFTPLAPYEAEITGNIASPGGGAPPEYIAGLVRLSQQPLNTSDGYILAIDYTKGELTIGPENGSPANPGNAHMRLNDPVLSASGRFGIGGSFDQRFKVDQDNATVRAATGFPMCIPRRDPAIAPDPECPQSNRPSAPSGFSTRFTMGPVDAMTMLPAAAAAGPGIFPATPCPGCNPRKQAPFEIGDRITYAGTLALDSTVTPARRYLSAHTVTAWVAIFTEPGKDPAYLSIEESLIGTGGIPFSGVDQETGPGKVVPGATGTTRLRIEAVATDVSRSVEVFALDYTGGPSDPVERSLGLPGFAKLRPAGTGTGVVTLAPSTKPPFGRLRLNIDRASFLPPPREIRVRYAGNPAAVVSTSFANGVFSGQYDAPVGEYIFPEALVFGQRPVPSNFENLCFLKNGTGPLRTLERGTGVVPLGPVVGPLQPWPDSGHATPQVPCP